MNFRMTDAQYAAYRDRQAKAYNAIDTTDQSIATIERVVAQEIERGNRFSLVLPWPPTANTNVRHGNGGHYMTTEHKSFRKTVADTVLAVKVKPVNGRLSCSIVAFPPDKRARDLDNLVKPILDALQHAGCYASDSQFDHVEISRSSGPQPGIVSVNVREI